MQESTALFERYEHVVAPIARGIVRKLPPCFDLDDLLQVGRLGLLDALRRWNPSRARTFEGYAAVRVRGAIINHVARAWKNEHHEELSAAAGVPAAGYDIDAEMRAWIDDCSSEHERFKRGFYVIWRMYEGWTQAETARELRCSQALVSQLQARALAVLRERLR